MSTNSALVDKKFIETILGQFEGKGIAKGYVPCDKKGQPLGASGVTIASGLDLGQQSQTTLISMGIPAPIVVKLIPYLGLKRQAALTKLQACPLSLTPAEVTAVDAAVHGAYMASATVLFGEKAFLAVPREVQAVAVSLHYQFGRPSRAASPALNEAWRAMQNGDYLKAAKVLRDPSGWSTSHQQYMKRREQEANLLEQAVKLGNEPQPSSTSAR